MRGPGRADTVNAGADIVNAGQTGSGESGYSECGDRGERIW
ncbi:unnamed protein product [Staurois parvus]|uniref:Uncharacterized protein n=1 Tax=Staurois parvus TaxID=386267 RepID=A0ABN9GBA5_9NEOB|nr:unnamed protein product [Staurois parvus]